MTSGRFWLIAATLTGTALFAGCGESGAPCTRCPPIQGRYPLEFADESVPADCAALGVALPEGPLDIQRAGSQLTASVDELPLQGTVYQSFDFTLQGAQAALDGGSTSLSFNGRYAPGNPDGGTGRISGSFSGTYARGSAQGTRRCSINRTYTATQQERP
ncbi:MAG: hypothetical protein JXB05_15740 [Myxococcaceae bacterium]|nr:hypothetical protein [Myxococcaceae bacterium]